MSIDNIADIAPRVQYVAATSQVAFDYNYPIFADADLTVDVDGVTKTLTTDYTVSGAGADTGGTVTFVTAPGNGAIVTIYRETEIARSTDFQQNGPFSSVSHNDELDKITVILQELKAQIGRAVRFPFTAVTSNAQALMSPFSNFTGKFLRVTSAGALEGAEALDNVTALSQELIGETFYPESDEEAALGDKVVNPFKIYGNIIRYGAVDDDTTDNSAAFQVAADIGHIIIPETSSKWAISSSVILNAGCKITAHGRESTIRQTSWGVPVFEIRAAGVSIDGHLYCETTETRSTFDGTALTASNNSATVKTEVSGDPKAAGSAIYCRPEGDNLYIQHLDVKGFIAGILGGSNDNVSIGQLTVEDVDFGAFSKPGDGWQIGKVNAISILRSQGVDEHAIYFPGDASNIGNGLTIGEITCASVQTGSHIVSLKYQKNFHIGAINGHTDVGSVFTAIESTGVVASYDVLASATPTNDAAGSGILCQTNSVITFGPGRFHSFQDNAVTSNAAVNCTGGGNLRMVSPDIKMLDASAGHAFRSSADMYLDNPRVEFDTDPTLGTGNSHAFNSDQASGFIEVNLPRVIGTQNVLRGSNSGVYEMTLVPDAVEDGLDTLSITSGAYNTRFIGDNGAVLSFSANDTTPSVRHGTLFQTANTNPTTITGFDHGSRGQRIVVLINDANTTIDFTATSLKRDGGTDWTPGSGDYLIGVYDEAADVWLCQTIEV